MKKQLKRIAKRLKREFNLSKPEVTLTGDLESDIFNKLKNKYLLQLNKNNNAREYKNELEFNKYIIENELEIVKHDSLVGRDIALLSVLILLIATMFQILDQIGMQVFLQTFYFLFVSLLLVFVLFMFLKQFHQKRIDMLYLGFKLKCINEALTIVKK